MAVSARDTVAISEFLKGKIETTGHKTGTFRYLDDWTDKKIGEQLALAEEAVAEIRRELYGHLTRGGGAGPMAALSERIDQMREAREIEREETMEQFATISRALDEIRSRLDVFGQRLTDLEEAKTSPAMHHQNGASRLI